MNKDKKIRYAKIMARNILIELQNAKCFDGFISRFYSKTKCVNYLQKNIDEYFKKNSQLINWNKNSWFDIFDDAYLLDALVFYMQDFNLAKEIESENEQKNVKKV